MMVFYPKENISQPITLPSSSYILSDSYYTMFSEFGGHGTMSIVRLETHLSLILRDLHNCEVLHMPPFSGKRVFSDKKDSSIFLSYKDNHLEDSLEFQFR